MLRSVVIFCLLSVAFGQYPRQRAPPQPEYDVEPEYDDYEARPPPRPAPRVAPQPRVSPNSVRLRPASVHYVNIGAELAGDYKFGYDTGKGDDGQSFREETRLPDGTVQGAYGYVDETGRQRIVKYTAGKDGFKVLKDSADDSKAATPSRPAPQPAPVHNQPPQPAAAYAPQHQPARSQAYAPPPQQARAPQPYAPPPPAARSPSRSQSPVQSYSPQPQPVRQAPPPPPVYRPEPQPQRSYAPQPQQRAQPRQRNYATEPPRRRYQEPDEEPDYDYPDNDIKERRLVVVDTSLFNYNIGTNGK